MCWNEDWFQSTTYSSLNFLQWHMALVNGRYPLMVFKPIESTVSIRASSGYVIREVTVRLGYLTLSSTVNFLFLLQMLFYVVLFGHCFFSPTSTPHKSLVACPLNSLCHWRYHSFLSPLPIPDTSLQLRRDVIFCQAATAALCTLAEQVLTALRSRFNNAGEYQEDGKETSRKWLEQISAIGILLHFQSTLAPHLVRTSFVFLFGS